MILLDAGLGAWSIGWGPVQAQLAETGTVCAYDRSGLGWSEPGSGEFDGATQARELHALVEAAGLERPFVYVGHSLGANLAQIYHHLYPEDIAGLVLIDPGTVVDMLEDFDGNEQDALAIDGCGWQCGLASTAAYLGLVRLAARKAGTRLMDEETNAIYRAGLARPRTVTAILGSLKALPKTAYQVAAAERFGDVPLTVLYSENTRKPEGEETEADVAAWHAATLERMGELAARSSRGTGPVVIPDTTHMSITLAPAAVESVAAEIRNVSAMAAAVSP
jgi:pimeloyl-ACP methyl ester carboxylesterase